LKVELNSDQLKANGPIAIRVSTTADVVTVVTGNGKRSGALTPGAPGMFTSQSTLPNLKLLAPIHIKLHFEAKSASGESVSADVPITYR
jgi:hypothetical protein